MKKYKMKKTINNEFGFAVNKIILFEGRKNTLGKYDYILFSVCDVHYQMSFNNKEMRYKLIVFESDERIGIY